MTNPVEIESFLHSVDWIMADIANVGTKGLGTTVNSNGIVDVKGSVLIFNEQMDQLPFQFGKVTGDFIVRGCGLKTLKGVPTEVGRDFVVSYNNLTTLQGCPKTVPGIFNCSANKLQNLVGGPEVVGDSYYASECGLITLHGMAKSVGGDIVVTKNRLRDDTQKFKIKSTGQMGYVAVTNWLTRDIIGSYILLDEQGNKIWNGNMSSWNPDQLAGVFEKKEPSKKRRMDERKPTKGGRLPLFEDFVYGYEIPDEDKKHRVSHDTKMIRWWGHPGKMVVVHKDRVKSRVDNVFDTKKLRDFERYFREAYRNDQKVDVECSYAFASVIEIIDVCEQQEAYIGGYLSHDYGFDEPASTGDEDWDYYLGQEDWDLIAEKMSWDGVYSETAKFFSDHKLDIVRYGKSESEIRRLWKATPYFDDEDDEAIFEEWMEFQLDMKKGIDRGDGDIGNIDIQIRDSNHRLQAAIAAGEQYVCIEIFDDHIRDPKIKEAINKDKEIEFVR